MDPKSKVLVNPNVETDFVGLSSSEIAVEEKDMGFAFSENTYPGTVIVACRYKADLSDPTYKRIASTPFGNTLGAV